MFPARLELATFRVLGGRDNHYHYGNCGKRRVSGRQLQFKRHTSHWCEKSLGFLQQFFSFPHRGIKYFSSVSHL